MCSSAGEVVNLSCPVTVTDAVEDWLNALTSEMRRTLSIQLIDAL